jgi:hypothetical protein
MSEVRLEVTSRIGAATDLEPCEGLLESFEASMRRNGYEEPECFTSDFEKRAVHGSAAPQFPQIVKAQQNSKARIDRHAGGTQGDFLGLQSQRESSLQDFAGRLLKVWRAERKPTAEGFEAVLSRKHDAKEACEQALPRFTQLSGIPGGFASHPQGKSLLKNVLVFQEPSRTGSLPQRCQALLSRATECSCQDEGEVAEFR